MREGGREAVLRESVSRISNARREEKDSVRQRFPAEIC